jgi:Plasmid pRiA4b ORF-3-like protein
MPPTPATTSTPIHLTVELLEISPRIWRRLIVDPSLTLGELHDVLQIAFGWTNSHLHRFSTSDGQRYSAPHDLEDEFGSIEGGAPAIDETPIDETRMEVASVLPAAGDALLYEYDFGDGWCHRIVRDDASRTSGRKDLPADSVAWCLGGERAGPLDDSGGPFGHERIVRLLHRPASKGSPKSPELRELLEWIPKGYDPELFDIDVVNAWLARLILAPRRRAKAAKKRPGPRRK